MQISEPHTLVCGIKPWLNFLLQVDKDDTCPCSDVMGACTPWTWSSRLHSLHSDAGLKSLVLVMQHLNTKRERWNISARVTERLLGLKLGSQMLRHIIFSKWTWDWWEMCLFSSICHIFDSSASTSTPPQDLCKYNVDFPSLHEAGSQAVSYRFIKSLHRGAALSFW